MDKMKANRIEIELPNGYKLVAEPSTDPQYKEICVGVEDADGLWQNLAIVCGSCHRDDGSNVVGSGQQFDVLVYGDKDSEDFTDKFTISQHQEE